MSLFPPQQALLNQGFPDAASNWLICAPTGSGKTRMAEWAMEAALKRGLRAAYIAPLRAIVEEKQAHWATRFDGAEVVAFTGELATGKSVGRPGQQRVLLFTPEKLSSYVQNWKRNLGWLSEIGVLVIDEFHLIGDRYRGAALEALISRIQRANPFIQIVGLSATLSNAEEIAQWLGARLFVSDWRPVPLQRRVRHFKRASDKAELLLSEVLGTGAEGGKTLAFVNSRRRAESLAIWLREQGVIADHSHAGLDGATRERVHGAMRRGELDVLVATTTVEMGVNFPARKVIVYDGYMFGGEAFEPLPVQRYLQFCGRAGRPGLDDVGEAVLFLPVWQGSGDEYLQGTPEPVRSPLFATHPLLREILYEVSTRLSISERHLETNFAGRSLWRAQGGQQDLGLHVRHLVVAGMLRETEKDGVRYLSDTALGRIAAQMSVWPFSVGLFAELGRRADTTFSEFDLLFAICLCPEVSPRLGFNFEEIDEMLGVLLEVPSSLLDQPWRQVATLATGIDEKVLLSAVKAAVILHLHAELHTLEDLADRFDAYPADLRMLQQSASWITEVASRVFDVLIASSAAAEPDSATDARPGLPVLAAMCERLRLMIRYGIPLHGLGLTDLKHVGPVRAQRFCKHGVFTPAQISELAANDVMSMLNTGRKTAESILRSAYEHLESGEAGVEQQALPPEQRRTTRRHKGLMGWPAEIDPYRLRRALDLVVEHASPEAVRVSGGAEPHLVRITESPLRERAYRCDCLDYLKGQPNCKHVLRARIALRDDRDLRPLVERLSRRENRPLRFALGELWMAVNGTYRLFNDPPSPGGSASSAANTSTPSRVRVRR